MRFAIVFSAVLLSVLVARHSVAHDRGSLAASTGRSLEDQLACLSPRKLALAIRAMVIAKTKFGADGVYVFRPTSALQVFGARIPFHHGLGNGRDPFSRGPGTSPPLFLAVVVDALPANVPYRERAIRRTDGVAVGQFSSVAATSEEYGKGGTTITCYGG